MKFSLFLIAAAVLVSIIFNVGFIIALGLIVAYGLTLFTSNIREYFENAYKQRRR